MRDLRKGAGDPRYLLFWPVFGVRYLLIERCRPETVYHVVHCALDDRIPFCEAFLIPYVLWYGFLIGMHLYTWRHDGEAYRRYSRCLIFSMSISTAIFLLYPTCQQLRPETYPRDNFLTDVVKLLHRIDTSTNVCPSEHVIGAAAALFAGLDCKSMRTPRRIAAVAVLAVLTSISTVFLKQHSVIDILAALPICVPAWLVVYRRPADKN